MVDVFGLDGVAYKTTDWANAKVPRKCKCWEGIILERLLKSHYDFLSF